MAEVTSIKWRANAYKLALLNRFIAGGSIQAWFRITFIYIFTAVWPCPSCCTCASENKKKESTWWKKEYQQFSPVTEPQNQSQLFPLKKKKKSLSVHCFFLLIVSDCTMNKSYIQVLLSQFI